MRIKWSFSFLTTVSKLYRTQIDGTPMVPSSVPWKVSIKYILFMTCTRATWFHACAYCWQPNLKYGTKNLIKYWKTRLWRLLYSWILQYWWLTSSRLLCIHSSATTVNTNFWVLFSFWPKLVPAYRWCWLENGFCKRSWFEIVGMKI